MRCYLLDGLRARDDYNGWDLETQAFEWFYREPAVGRHAGRRPVELLHRLVSACVRQGRLPDLQVGDVPDRRAAAVAGRREGRVHATATPSVGLSMSGNSAMILAVYHPEMFIYAGSLSAFLNPSEGQWPFLINMAMGDAGGY